MSKSRRNYDKNWKHRTLIGLRDDVKEAKPHGMHQKHERITSHDKTFVIDVYKDGSMILEGIHGTWDSKDFKKVKNFTNPHF